MSFLCLHLYRGVLLQCSKVLAKDLIYSKVLAQDLSNAWSLSPGFSFVHRRPIFYVVLLRNTSCIYLNLMCVHTALVYADALLEVKKQRLLFSLETVETEASRKTESPRSGGGGEGEGKECGESSEDSDDLQGIKCQAPVEEV